ncbi:MAG: hypothetical protein PV362_04360, partial [Providencia heimbachae]|nr:hypothetical protein [Providencia heimbachae]
LLVSLSRKYFLMADLIVDSVSDLSTGRSSTSIPSIVMLTLILHFSFFIAALTLDQAELISLPSTSGSLSSFFFTASQRDILLCSNAQVVNLSVIVEA